MAHTGRPSFHHWSHSIHTQKSSVYSNNRGEYFHQISLVLISYKTDGALHQ